MHTELSVLVVRVVELPCSEDNTKSKNLVNLFHLFALTWTMIIRFVLSLILCSGLNKFLTDFFKSKVYKFTMIVYLGS